MIKTCVLYHRDADGFCSAFAHYLTNEPSYYIDVNYNEDLPPIPDGVEKLYILDFSYRRDILDDLATKYNLVVIDHHKSTIAALEGAPYAITDITKSGARLSWEHFNPGVPVPSIVSYVEDYDLWRFSLPDSMVINSAINALPHEFTVWHRYRNDISALYDNGLVINMYQKTLVERCSETAYMMTFVGYHAIVCNCTSTDICNLMADKFNAMHPDLLFVGWYKNEAGSYKYSLRSSTSAIDCSEIAKQFDGGGHFHAAGFHSNELLV